MNKRRHSAGPDATNQFPARGLHARRHEAIEAKVDEIAGQLEIREKVMEELVEQR